MQGREDAIAKIKDENNKLKEEMNQLLTRSKKDSKHLEEKSMKEERTQNTMRKKGNFEERSAVISEEDERRIIARLLFLIEAKEDDVRNKIRNL